MGYFPTAQEVYYKWILADILNKINKSNQNFIDITLCNDRINDYLTNKGYVLKELRYEYKDNIFGFWGRTSGDGHCLLRISWGDSKFDLSQEGDFRPKS